MIYTLLYICAVKCPYCHCHCHCPILTFLQEHTCVVRCTLVCVYQIKYNIAVYFKLRRS